MGIRRDVKYTVVYLPTIVLLFFRTHLPVWLVSSNIPPALPDFCRIFTDWLCAFWSRDSSSATIFFPHPKMFDSCFTSGKTRAALLSRTLPLWFWDLKRCLKSRVCCPNVWVSLSVRSWRTHSSIAGTLGLGDVCNTNWQMKLWRVLEAAVVWKVFWFWRWSFKDYSLSALKQLPSILIFGELVQRFWLK